MVFGVSTRTIPDTLHRSLPYGLRTVVGELELRGAVLVSDDDIAQFAGIAPHTSAAYDLVHRLVASRWLRPLPVRGRYEFLPGRAGPFSREDPLDPLRAIIAERDVATQVVLAGAAFLRGFSDRPPVAWDVLLPRGYWVSTSLRERYRFHWVAPGRIFGAGDVDGVPVSTSERLLLDVALWPTEVGAALKLRDHWLAAALADVAADVVVAMLVRLASPAVTARAGYLAASFGRSDLADAIATLGRSRIAVPLLPGVEGTTTTRDARFNVIDPVGASSVS